AKLTNTMLIAGAVVLLVSPLGGYWLAGRATRPLARIIDTTARLHPSNLEERLQIRGTRDELDRLSQTVNALLDRIAAYISQNRQFTANAAHELRSPLAAIQNSLEVGLNADRSAEEYHELLGETLEECGVLRDLVNQMLLLAESDAGRLEVSPDPFRLDLVAQKSHEMFVGVAEAADLRLRLDCQGPPVLIYGDANRLRQVVNNLIDNAIKFSQAGGTITVSVHREHARHAVLEVADTGIGIAAEDLPHVFERFYRGDKSRQRKDRSGGTGLGLSICSSIAAAHNGTIKVESTLGQGTTVTVTLPLAEGARPEEIGLPLKNIESSPAA
ncbi:MAG TPA: ATP-binding protein, partial [Pirellulales bacterium]